MNFNEYQDKAASTDIYPLESALVCHVFGLANEAGEVAGKIKKVYRDKQGHFSTEIRADIAKELGDTLWYLSSIARDIGYTLEYIAEMNIEKLADRKERNVIGGSGDHR